MKIKGESYEGEVIVPKVWEHIIVNDKKETVLVTQIVSDYIRSLESQLETHRVTGKRYRK